MPGAQEPAAGTGRKPGPHEGAGHTRARRHVGQRRGRLPISHFKGDGPLKTKTVTMFRGVCDVRNEMRSDRTTDAGGHRGGGLLPHGKRRGDSGTRGRPATRSANPVATSGVRHLRLRSHEEKRITKRHSVQEKAGKTEQRTDGKHKSNSNADYSRGSATITVNVNGLNPPIKRQRLPDGVEKQDPTERCL